MADDVVTHERLFAGRDYLLALVTLGLRPEALLWTIGGDADPDPKLSLVTSLVEHAGPKALYDLLFKAYEHAGTPKNIDPWIVDLYGPRSSFARQLSFLPEVSNFELLDADGVVLRVAEPWIDVQGRLAKKSWIYVKNFRRRGIGDDIHAINRFRRNVEALAA